jgi:hypothetical protein
MKEILFVRYAPGSAGNFLISMLQSSHKVACWDMSVEQSKNTNQFNATYINWFKRSFSNNLNEHLKKEPHYPYNLDFFSSKHNRGNDIDDSEFIRLLKKHDNFIFLDNIKKNKLTVMRLNKAMVPKFGANSTIINIIIDQPSYKWLHRIRQVKLFGYKDHQFIHKENHPDYLKAKRKNNVFNNPYIFNESYFSFARNKIIGEQVVKIFKNRADLLSDQSNLMCQQHFILLSDLLNKDKIFSIIQTLFDELNLGIPELNLISECFDHYKKTNIDPIKWPPIST